MKNKDLEKAIYRWFDMKYELYSRLENYGVIYLYNEGQKYADIAIYKKYTEIYVNLDFWEEFSEIFPIEFGEFIEVISKWVGDTYNLKEFTHGLSVFLRKTQLEIPNYKHN